MPGPFPGMDPYLEDPFTWQGVHNSLITYMAAALNAVLPPDYVADTGVRCLVEYQPGAVIPDVIVQEERAPADIGRGVGAALLEVRREIDAPLVLRAKSQEERQGFLNIINVRSEQIVTVIELLSPMNKNAHNVGWETYRRKQQDLLASATSLIEIDLLREGTYALAVPQTLLPRPDTWDYLTCLHRGGRGLEFEVWPHTLRDRLSCIAVPLAPGQSDVPLDLQQPFNRMYDEGRYNRKIRYEQEPVPPLTMEDAAWVDVLLRTHGLRE